MDQSANNITGALPLLSYAGSPAEGACELVIITQNAAKNDIHICVQRDSRHWQFHDTYSSTWYFSSFLKIDLFLPKKELALFRNLSMQCHSQVFLFQLMITPAAMEEQQVQ